MAKQKTYEELTFTDDFIFCKLLQNNEILCKELLELILGVNIKQIVYPENQKTIEITSDGKGVRLDIYVEDEEETVYDVEMQTTISRNLPKRSRYYQGMIDLNLIERGADYQELKKCYIIFICLEDCFGKGLHKYSFSTRCNELPELQLKDETEKIFLCAEAAGADVSQPMEQFLHYLTRREVTNDFTKRIEEEVTYIKSHEEWRLEYMTLYMRDRENQEIGRAEGITEGKLEGKAESIIALLEDYGTIPAYLQEKIYAQQDIEILHRWLKFAAKADSLAQFEEMISPNIFV